MAKKIVDTPAKSFWEHTVERRLFLSSLWYVDEWIHGDIGCIVSSPTHCHRYSGHFKQLYPSYPAALKTAQDILEKELMKPIMIHPKNFEELYDYVKKLLKLPVKGIGGVATYDIALIIGCNLYPKVLPKNFVYIHGTPVTASAKKLLGKKSFPNDREPISSFSTLFPNINAMEIEDILCVYNNKISTSSKGFDLSWLNVMP